MQNQIENSPETLSKLNAFNAWLEAIYGEKILISDILSRAGFSSEQINKLKTNHLNAYLDTVLSYLQSIEDGHDATRRHEVMLRHYGLLTGRKETLQSIADEFQISRERIRQLVEKRLQLLRTKKWKAVLEAELAAIAHRFLESE